MSDLIPKRNPLRAPNALAALLGATCCSDTSRNYIQLLTRRRVHGLHDARALLVWPMVVFGRTRQQVGQLP
jgi:hypothetical protein